MELSDDLVGISVGRFNLVFGGDRLEEWSTVMPETTGINPLIIEIIQASQIEAGNFFSSLFSSKVS